MANNNRVRLIAAVRSFPNAAEFVDSLTPAEIVVLAYDHSFWPPGESPAESIARAELAAAEAAIGRAQETLRLQSRVARALSEVDP